MKDLDKTKENIGVDKLDQKTRKDLFDRFVDSGGEVVPDRRKRRPMVIDREKQRDYQTRLDEHAKKNKSGKSPGSKKPAKGKISAGKTSTPKESWYTRLSATFKVSFHLRMMRITKSRGFYFNLKFLERFNNSYKPALMEIQVQYLNIFKKDPANGRRVTQRLDKANPLFFEVIEMIGNIYDKLTADQIVDHYINFPDVPKKVSDLRDPILELFRRLYLLKPYENTILNSFFKSYEIQQKLEGEKISGISAEKKKIKNALFIIFHKLYPRLHWLLCLYSGEYIEPDSTAIEDILEITQAEKPGNRTTYDPGEQEIIDAGLPETEKEVPEEKELLPEEVKRGLQVMYQLDPKELRRQFDKKKLFEHISDSDKVMITFLLFSEFDREYSVILTTNKIKYNVDFTQSGKFNFGIRLNDLYDEMRKPGETLRDYAETVANFEKVRRQKPASNDQYIGYSKRLQEMQKKRNQSGKAARMAVRSFMEKLCVALKELIDDMNTNQKFLSNPQEELQFDDLIEGDKKLNGQKVYKSIQIVYDYASAFVYRLNPGGDLYGSLDKKDDEKDHPSPGTDRTKKPPQEEEKLESLEEIDTSRSVIDELDDLL